MRISNYLTYREVTRSYEAKRRGIKNTPSKEELSNLEDIAVNVFDKVRECIGAPLGITSGFRCKALNTAVGGAKYSDHMTGRALDIDVDIFGNGTNAEVFEFIKDNLEFDKLIWEFGTDDEPSWVHVSYNKNRNRGIVLKAYKDGRKTKYKEI